MTIEISAARQRLYDEAIAYAAGDINDRDRQRILCEAAKAYSRAFLEAARNPPGSEPRASGDVAVFPNYGRAKGLPVRGAEVGDLRFYRAGCERTLADPSKARFHAKERALLAAIEAELEGR